jgi:ribonuclease Z
MQRQCGLGRRSRFSFNFRVTHLVLLISPIVCIPLFAAAFGSEVDHSMKIILLGTGTPYPDAERFGSAILVEAGRTRVLFDCGRGNVIRLSEAGVGPNDIESVYLTHLHSDHVTGLPDLWLTGWFLGRQKPLRVWGPTGTRAMAQHLAEAFSFDVQTRVRTEHLPLQGAEINAQDIVDGTVLNDGPIRVTAFPVDHGPVKPALGYRIDYSGHSLVISGDTRVSDELINHAKGVDCLIHVAWSIGATNSTPPSQRSIASAEDAAHVFAMTRPKLAVVYHYKSAAGLSDAIRAEYKGPFVIAKDLMTIDIDRTITWRNNASSETIQ